jgi:O-antigen/teichoic acid export membrane protein
MTGARRILSNIGALSLARGVTAALALVTMIHLARVLEPEAYGMLVWALAFVAYFHLLPDLGLSVLGAREVARTPAEAREIARSVLSIRLPLAAVTIALYLAAVVLLPAPPLFKFVIAVQGGALIAAAISLEFVYQGVERMGILAVRNVLVAILTLIGAIVFVRQPADVPVAAGILVTSMLIGNVWILFAFRRDFGSLRLPRPSITRWRPLLSQSLPIAASLILVTINLNIDQLLLGVLRSAEEVGLYGAAYRILLAATIPAQIIVMAFLPSLSRAYGSRDGMCERGRAFARVILPIGLPLCLAGALLAPELMAIFGPQYAPAAVAFSILMVQGGFFYIQQLYAQALIAWNEQRRLLYALGIGGITNVLLNLLLIPRYGMEGAAIATVGAEVAIVGCLVFIFRRLALPLYGRELARAMVLGVVAIVAVGLGRAVLGLPLLATLALTGSFIIVSAVALRLITVDDLRALRGIPRRQAS